MVATCGYAPRLSMAQSHCPAFWKLFNYFRSFCPLATVFGTLGGRTVMPFVWSSSWLHPFPPGTAPELAILPRDRSMTITRDGWRLPHWCLMSAMTRDLAAVLKCITGGDFNFSEWSSKWSSKLLEFLPLKTVLSLPRIPGCGSHRALCHSVCWGEF